MAMYIQIAQIILFAALVDGGVLMSPGMMAARPQRTPAELDAKCTARCAGSGCYLEDSTDCRRYIMCELDPRGVYHATLMDCAFGAYWNGEFTCAHPQTVTCNIDYCFGKVGPHYAHTGNCKTFWRCGVKGPEARCCNDGTYYDTITNTCMPDIAGTCLDVCPIHQERCNKGLPTEDYEDANCKTYYNCEDTINHPVCCPDGEGYNSTTNRCEVYACKDVCPQKYAPVTVACNLKPGPTPESFYLGTTLMDCSGGTLFDQSTCACGKHVKGAPDNSCNIELDVKFDHKGWRRSGTQKAGVVPSGEAFPGPLYQNVASQQFNGNLIYRVMYFQQVFPNLYTNLVYQPDDSAAVTRRIVLSNCMNTDLGGPSLELYLLDGKINLLLVTDTLVNDTAIPGQMKYSTAVISVAYRPNVWNRFIAVYNGQNVYVLNEFVGNSQIPPETATTPLTGAISVAAEGLDIGKCNMMSNRNIRGFEGSIAELQFTKCLRQEWINSYNAKAQTVNPAPVNNPMDISP